MDQLPQEIVCEIMGYVPEYTFLVNKELHNDIYNKVNKVSIYCRSGRFCDIHKISKNQDLIDVVADILRKLSDHEKQNEYFNPMKFIRKVISSDLPRALYLMITGDIGDHFVEFVEREYCWSHDFIIRSYSNIGLDIIMVSCYLEVYREEYTEDDITKDNIEQLVGNKLHNSLALVAAEYPDEIKKLFPDDIDLVISSAMNYDRVPYVINELIRGRYTNEKLESMSRGDLMIAIKKLTEYISEMAESDSYNSYY